MSTLDEILKRSDRDESVASIAVATGKSPGWIYKVLREHRPNRPRKPRKVTSDLPETIRALASEHKPSSIARRLGVSRAYVYKVLQQAA